MRNEDTTKMLLAVGLILYFGSVLYSSPDDVNDKPDIGTEEGEMYPDFYLQRLDGSYGRLSDYRGKKVILFQFASW